MNAPDLDTITLAVGSHAKRDDGVCAMELVAWLAGEPHSDHPACTSPVLAAFFRRWNDDLDDSGRQRLKPYLPRLIGTAGDGHDELRGWMLTDWMVRVYTPAWLDLAKLTDQADALRALPEIRTIAALGVAKGALDDARTKAAAAWDAARAAAWAAAWAAARAAARAAAWDAAWAAAWDAAWDAAWAAARDAARAAACDAARAAARAAAWAAAVKKLEPTKISIQESAFDLIERLIDPVSP